MSKVDAEQHDEIAEKAGHALSGLIAEQGAKPIDDLDRLAALWPADDDPDALMKFVLSERQARAQLPSEDRQSE